MERQWQENVLTAEGQILHERVHDSSMQDSRNGVVTLRGVALMSYELGLQGLADVVEFYPAQHDGEGVKLNGYRGYYVPRPVEYKRGKPKTDDRDKVQLCAQAMCLEEIYKVNIGDGSLFYGQTRRRIDVLFTDQLRKRVKELVQQMHKVFDMGITPVAQPWMKCDMCSMLDICLPDITRKSKSVKDYLNDKINELI